MIPDPTATLPPDSPAAASMERGRRLRKVATRRGQASWTPTPDRVDPVDTLIASNVGRIQELVPIRIGRMLASPFAFLRGSAAVNPAEIAGYLGMSTRFDDAIAAFGVAYADQTERDHAALIAAVRTGRLAAESGV